MSSDLLPEWLNLLLDDVETNLCLPILLVMILCTVQFIINHVVDIGYTIYQSVTQCSDEDEELMEKEPCESLMDRIKGYICSLALNSEDSDIKHDEPAAPQLLRSNSREDEWDYCEEDDE